MRMKNNEFGSVCVEMRWVSSVIKNEGKCQNEKTSCYPDLKSDTRVLSEAPYEKKAANGIQMYEETQKIVECSIWEKKIESRAIRSHDTETMLGPSRKGTTGNV